MGHVSTAISGPLTVKEPRVFGDMQRQAGMFPSVPKEIGRLRSTAPPAAGQSSMPRPPIIFGIAKRLL